MESDPPKHPEETNQVESSDGFCRGGRSRRTSRYPGAQGEEEATVWGFRPRREETLLRTTPAPTKLQFSGPRKTFFSPSEKVGQTFSMFLFLYVRAEHYKHLDQTLCPYTRRIIKKEKKRVSCQLHDTALSLHIAAWECAPNNLVVQVEEKRSLSLEEEFALKTDT